MTMIVSFVKHWKNSSIDEIEYDPTNDSLDEQTVSFVQYLPLTQITQ